MDERVAETFTAPGDEVERLMYGYSLLCCLAGRHGAPAVGRDRHRDAAGHAAGLRGRGGVRATSRSSTSQHDFFRFYRLR